MEDLLAGAMIVIVLVLVLLLPILIVYLIGLWKLFKKAGHEGWEAIIPFYNTWVLAEISGTAWWYALIIIISNLGILGDNIGLEWLLNLAALVSNFFIFYNLSKKFHKGVGFAVAMTFLPIIMIPIMGFSSNFQYDATVSVSENGPIGDNNDSNNQNNSSNYQNNSSNYTETNNTTNNSYNQPQYCQYCGTQVNENAKFCGNCGNEIRK